MRGVDTIKIQNRWQNTPFFLSCKQYLFVFQLSTVPHCHSETKPSRAHVCIWKPINGEKQKAMGDVTQSFNKQTILQCGLKSCRTVLDYKD